MNRTKIKQTRRARRKIGIRKRAIGSPQRPRLTVYRSLKQFYAQIIDDLAGRTLVAASSLKPRLANGGDKQAAAQVGKLLAEHAADAGIQKVCFDRSGFKYHGRVKAFAEAARKAQEAEFEEDPISALRKNQEQLQARIDAQNTEKSEEEKAAEAAEAQQTEFQNMLRTVSAQVAEFEAENPDYPQAFQFMMDKRIEEYKALGITDPVEIRQEFDREAIALSANALQRSVNPGEAVYKLAVGRGYVKTEALAEVEDADAKNTLEESMDRLEKGSKASSSLTGGSGGKSEGGLSLSDIDKMSDKEFDDLWDKMGSGSIYSN